MSARLIASLIVVMGGCAPSIELGTGLDQFVPLSDGDRVALVLGPQGGHHVWASARGRGLPRDTSLEFELRLDGGDLVSTRTDVTDGGSFEHLGTAVFVPEPDRVRARRCFLSLRAQNLSDVREVVIE